MSEASETTPPRGDPRKPKSTARKMLDFSLGAILVLLAAAALGRYALWRWADEPRGSDSVTHLVIQPRTPLRAVGDELARRGLISSSRAFVLYVLLTGRRNAIQAGEYEIATPVSPEKLIQELRHGSFQQRLTIPEGWTAARIERALLEGGWIRREGEWLDLVSQPVSGEYLGEDIVFGAEGFCFPDTYLLEKGTRPALILDRMLRRFAQNWKGLRPWERDPRSADLTTRQVVTLASMIEREARGTKEMPEIASVYLNRLKKRMRLQCCATVHFALGEVWDRALTFKDLDIDSSYNTYRHEGLPPGPIGNPGRAALEAVLRPADTPFLFYVYRGDGTHEFTRTYQEHMRAARKYHQSDPAAELVSSGE